ncbi:glycosyltransferase [Thiocystis violacea]|uniref:glycosyltransferase n=1 Tax=Thiocystis violacea TaxID=13725 RepID=UPI001905A351|nr:nucleotide disphospho-sugar-binding domain-containing protein [Thiocystis violacea]MBK1724534.1 hypothetical protein [Thiocystis violacea]
MSRFLFSTMGSLGDLHPYIAIARALIEQNHSAVIATAEHYRGAVEGAGIEFAPVRPDVADLGDYPRLVETLFDIRRGPEHLIRQVVMPYLRPAYASLMAASADADLLVSHTLAMTLPIVAERRGLPWVATVLAPMSFMSAFDPPLIATQPWLQKLHGFGPWPHQLAFWLFKRSIWGWEAPLRALRAELGVSPLRRLALFEGQFSPHRNLALFDAALARPQRDWPPRTHICGCPIYDGQPEDAALRAELDAFLAEGEPPIVFALGSSAVWIAGDFWEHAVSAARQLDRRALLITGPATPENLPDGIRAFPYLPYSRAFPRSAAVVHQAGIGTLSHAMRSGRPQLLVPVAFDQPDNARRAIALGVGRSLPFRAITGARLAEELRRLLDEPRHTQAAADLARHLSEKEGATEAAEALIACLAEASASGRR